MKTYKMLFALIVISILFLSNSLLSNSNGIEQDGKYLAFAEEMPEPIGGIGAIIKNIKYPAVALKSGIQGKVYVLAHVNESGVAEEVKVVRGIGGGCDEAAVEAVKLAKFKPGKNKGKTVKVKLTMAITFKLN